MERGGTEGLRGRGQGQRGGFREESREVWSGRGKAELQVGKIEGKRAARAGGQKGMGFCGAELSHGAQTCGSVFIACVTVTCPSGSLGAVAAGHQSDPGSANPPV